MIENIFKLIGLIRSKGDWRAIVRAAMQIIDQALDMLPDGTPATAYASIPGGEVNKLVSHVGEEAAIAELESVVEASKSNSATFPWESLVPVLLSIIERFLARRSGQR